jgi:hypothetical protein
VTLRPVLPLLRVSWRLPEELALETRNDGGTLVFRVSEPQPR